MTRIIDSKVLIAGGILGLAALFIFLSRFVVRLQVKFKDRNAAASILADIIRGKARRIGATSSRDRELIVVGIPRGGIIIADVIARKLSAQFDITIAMKLGEPNNKENALGAIAENDTIYIDETVVSKLHISKEYMENEISDMKEEIAKRIALYRSGPGKNMPNLRGKTVVLVDDGAITGCTLIAAARSIKRDKPKHLTIATPSAPRETLKLLKGEADDVQVILSPPASDFLTVGQFYQNFNPVSNEQVIETIRNRNLLKS